LRSIDALISELRELNVTLSVRGEELSCRAPKGTLTPQLTRELSARKGDILQFLKQADALTAGDDDAIRPVPRDQPLRLSFGQQRLWFLDRLEGPSATYTMPLAVRLEGALDVRALEKALVEITRRHEVLRTNFIVRDQQPVPHIHQTADSYLTIRSLDKPLPNTPTEQKATVRRLAEAEAHRSFDLASDRLLRATLVRLSETAHLFLVTMHHIISDGWSLEVFIRELVSLYTSVSQGLPASLPELPIQYTDYAHWQRQRLQGKLLANQLPYWRNQLAGAPEILALPTDRPRPPIQTYRGESVTSVLDAALTRRLYGLRQSSGTTLFMTLLSGFAVLLARYSGQQDIVIGTVIANRNHPNLEALMGLFINTLVLRFDLSGNPSSRNFLEQVRRTCLQAYDNQDLPFELLVEELQPARALSYSPLVQVAFDLSTPMDKIEMPGLIMLPVEQQAIAAKFDLSLSVEETGTELHALWNYNPDLFDEATIIRMMNHYRNLLAGMAVDPDKPVFQLPLLEERERQQIIRAYNETAATYPREHTVPSLFEVWADRVPDRLAASFADQALTYSQLKQRAYQLAAYLQSLGVGPEVLVALCVERSLEMVIGLLGILKAGGAYIPLDPAYPHERLARVVDDAGAAVVLTQEHLQAALSGITARVICLDRDWSAIAATSRGRLSCQVAPENIAYVIYTSGSTGRPKGVQVSHRALLNLLISMQQEPGLTERDVFLAVTTIAFDIAALEIYLPLIAGSHFVLAERETTLDGRRLRAVLQTRAVTHMQATPATWRMLADTGWDPPLSFTALCGGEALPVALARQIVQKDARLWNLYGPTETTIWSAVRRVKPTKRGEVPRRNTEGVEPIGRPISNTQIYILDLHGQPLPVGVPGELYIGGDGLARGYLNQPWLTANSYLPDPFSAADGARLYRTGDLVRRLPNGDIDFLGRIDHQVKIRGFRIELGEIEASLYQYPGIREVVVLTREDTPGDKRLVAYLMAAHDPPPEIDLLRARLKDTLPEYMLPAAFIFLAAMPLTPSGKVNRQALPAPDQSRPELSASFLTPRTELERTIAEVWRQALRVDEVGVDDNFFALGGHSLLITQVHEGLRERLARSFPLVTLFQYPTIRTLATWLSQEEVPAAISIRPRAPHAGEATEDIAIIGLAGRFPEADDLQTFWANLRGGRESIRFFSEQELLAAGMEPELIAQSNYVRANGSLSDITSFDAAFFGITPAEAEVMDPQHRLFLETAWHTMEHAGYGAGRSRAAIGVFAGCSHNGYLVHNLLPNIMDSATSHAIHQLILGNEKDYLPTRVSYALDLKGPSVNVQTACSTSLVAVHLACKSLLDGECEMALAGGVGLKIPQTSGYLYQEGMIHSPDGHCRAFDAKAQGTSWGSGLGVVLLKRLDAARADRDTIHAVIKGSAINNDGSLKVSFTAPGVEGQAEVIANAQARAGVAPDSVSYIEAHGTGTLLGDPVEVAALTRAFRAGTDKQQFCALGSVKTNIGHLDTAAGIAGLFKTVLALQHRQIPPTLHFHDANPEIDFSHSPFYVNDRLRDWPANGTPRRAGVSSLGIGGTNAHVIVEEAPTPGPSVSPRPWQLLILSARSQKAADNLRINLSAHLRDHCDVALADVAHTLGVGRRQFAHRIAVVCRDTADAAAALQSVERLRAGHIRKVQPDQAVAFMFPGQGAQYATMGAELYRTEAVFREQIDRCAELLRQELGLDLRRAMYPQPEEIDAANAQLSQTWLTQPALFVTEFALARLWLSWGVVPRAMIGHSLGEYVAACLAGVYDVETALRLVARRGRLIWDRPLGAMLAVSLSARDLYPLLSDSLSVAAVNTLEDCVVSGPSPALKMLAAQLENDAIPCRWLRTSHAFHSAMMEPLVAAFTELLKNVRLNPPELPFVSNLTGAWIRPEEAVDPNYWAEHLRQTVNFERGVGTLLGDPDVTLLEVGPGTTLSAFARRHPLAKKGRSVLSSLRRADPNRVAKEGCGETETLLDSLGQLWVGGIDIDWSAYYAKERLSRVPLPGYPFERQRHWIDAPARAALSSRPLAHKKLPFEQWFYLPGWKPTLTPRSVCAEDFAGPSFPWLVFSDGSSLSQQTIARLKHGGQEVVTVLRGDRYEQHGQIVCLRPLSPNDYESLIQAVGGRPSYKIVHFWSLSATDQCGPDYFARAQEEGYYSLLFLGRALARQQYPGATIAIIANNLHDVSGLGEACPEKATLLGPCLVMPQEIPQITCRCVDIVVPPEGTTAEADLVEGLVDILLAELEIGPPDPFVAYRGRRRLVPSFDRVTLDSKAGAVRQLRHQGVYLITGGLGNVGLLLARFLAEAVQARIVLVGRSFFPERSQWEAWLQYHSDNEDICRKIRQIREVEALGAKVLLVRADVADEREMRAALAQAHRQFGALHGIIHAAGRLNDPSFISPFTEVGEQESQAQFAPKIYGLYVLEKVLWEQVLDFCLVISSNSAVLGGIGFAAYSAANSFIDAFAARQNQLGGTPWLSANWDTWLFDEPSEMSPVAEFSMTPREAIAAFQRLVSCVADGRMIVSTGDLQARFDQWVQRREQGPEKQSTSTPETQHSRPDVAVSYSAPTSEVESQLASLWQELLGFTTVGIHDDFFELGGDSLTAIRLMTMIKEEFGRQFPPAVLLAKPTIHQLAKSLEQPTATVSFSPMVAIQPKGTLAPFFCVPGTGGNVLYFHDLAGCMAEYDRPFYAFQALGLDGRTPPLTRIEEIAALNVQALQEVQPRGPYHLGGHSFGSWVALEMARQLQREGHEVALVAILDTGVPSARDLSAMGGWDDTRWLVAVADTLSRIYEKRLALQYDQLAQLTPTAQLEALTRAMETLGIVQPGTNAGEIRGFVEVYKTQAQIPYNPEPDSPVRLVLFRAREPLADFLLGMPESLRNDEAWGWQQYSKGPPVVEYVPGDHLTMMSHPHVRQLADRLHTVLCAEQGT